jgi:drug/metabolite transporter (DMT)-like permease
MPYAPPMKFLLVRYLLSVACFLPWIFIARVRWPSNRSQWLHLAITGVFIHAGYLGGVWAAVRAGLGSGLAALIVGLQPVLTALWLASAGGKIAPRQWVGLLLGFAGLVMVVSRKFGQGSEANGINLTLAVGALLSITLGTLYQKRFVTPCDVRTASTVQLGAAFLVTLPLALMEIESMQWNTNLAGAMVWSVLVLTLGGSSLLYMLIQRGAAASVTTLMYLVPPVTAFMAWLLFEEPITLTTIVGTVITAVGVALVVKQVAVTAPKSF